MPGTHREKRTHGTQGFPFQIYPALDMVESDLVPYHWHPENEIIIAEQGEVGLTIGDRQYTARQGDIFFVNAETLHEIRGGPAGRFHAYVFPADFLQFARADLAQSELLAPLYDGHLLFRTELRREQAPSGAVRQELDAVLRACTEKLPGYQLLVKASLLHIVALAAAHGLLAPRASRTDYKSETLRQIVGFLDEHCTERLRLEEVAARFGLSPQYFCTFFKDNLGRTLTQHVNFLRIERAARLLRESDEAVSDVAMSVGFDNFSYFIRRFRECYDCTPTAYRKTAHEGQWGRKENKI